LVFLAGGLAVYVGEVMKAGAKTIEVGKIMDHGGGAGCVTYSSDRRKTPHKCAIIANAIITTRTSDTKMDRRRSWRASFVDAATQIGGMIENATISVTPNAMAV
jgi:hypothetical protein